MGWFRFTVSSMELYQWGSLPLGMKNIDVKQGVWTDPQEPQVSGAFIKV